MGRDRDGDEGGAGGGDVSGVGAVSVGGVILARGTTRICVPLMGRDEGEFAARAASVPPGACDLVELRADHLDHVDAGTVTRAVEAVRRALPAGVPVLLTLRTLSQGGRWDTSAAGYVALLESVLAGGAPVDALDVEDSTPAAGRDRLVARAHARGVPVVMSSHDFTRTPTAEWLVGALGVQQDHGADVVKVAVMPHDAADVVAVLAATVAYTSRPDARPAVVIAMGALGVSTRVSGATFGSCLTFGTVGEPSAPGQIPAPELRHVLDLLSPGD